ncbi:MAG: hypothetical protein LJE70_17905 [Chromatiaceae bacterium]|nr:hypothetical protein [Chromatiaceae bacterium]
MSTPRLIFGLLDNSTDYPDCRAAARARDLTIGWTRFKYFGPILEDKRLDGILQRAADEDADYCFIQVYGHILAEVWHPDAGQAVPIMQAIEQWIEQKDFLVCGHLLVKPGQWYGLKPDCLLIDLNRYRALGCPLVEDPGPVKGDCRLHLMVGTLSDGQALAPTSERARISPRLPGWSLVRLSLEAGHTVFEFPTAIDAAMVTLDPRRPERWMNRQIPVAESALSEEPESNGKQHLFLEGVRRLTEDLPRSIFVWNLESYEDVETPAEGFEAPLKALYTVSAGFKPNRMLQTHGFDSKTRMLVFDYSPQGLEFRRLIHEEWDGVDYPSFLRVLFRKLPSGEAHYLLWDGMTPENLDWKTVDRRWQQELAAWGGEEILYEHWQRFRRIRVEYLVCNLLTEQGKLIETIKDEPNALIWWSNAFFSIYSNWRYSAAERQGIYLQWIENLARKAPQLWIYGSDCHNMSVNSYKVSQYLDWLRSALENGFDELTPPALNRYQISF